MLRRCWEPNSPSGQAEARGNGRGTRNVGSNFLHLWSGSKVAVSTVLNTSCAFHHLTMFLHGRIQPPSLSKENSGSSRTKSLHIISFPIIGCKVLKIIRYLNRVLSRLLRTIRREYRALPQTGIKRSPNKINCLA
jgi:hypothetical protein